MKFPRKLSKERLSLLSPEDRKIYEYEHSGLCPEMNMLTEKKKKKSRKNDKGETVPEYCSCGGKIRVAIKGEPVFVCTKCDKYYGTLPFKESYNYDSLSDLSKNHLTDEYKDSEQNDDDEELKQIFDELMFGLLFDELYDKELIEEVGLEEYNNIKKEIFEYIINDPDLKTLNEAEGRAADWWIDCSWLVKLSAGLLTGLLGLIAWLIMKGKDRLAMVKLKLYMNKLVELTDSGINKKRPWYSFLLPSRKGKQNTGDYNKACFRTIQETAERNMACLYTLAIHSLGFLDPGIQNFNKITSGLIPDDNSGLGKFKLLVEKNTNESDSLYSADDFQKLLPVNLINNDYFENLKLPSLPTNYSMLMSNIDYPTKANENPNGSLFMKPTEEILQDKGSDIGLTYFGGDVKSVIKTDKMGDSLNNGQLNESYGFPYKNSMLSYLFEVENKEGLDATKDGDFDGLLTNDLTNGVSGAELVLTIKGREKVEVSNFKGNIIDAIDNYVRMSIPVISKLMRSICGKGASSEMSKFTLLIATLNNASEGNISAFMKKHDSVLHDIVENDYNREYNKARDFNEVAQHINEVTYATTNPEICKKIGLTDLKKQVEFRKVLNKLIRDTSTTEKDLSMYIQKYTICKKFDDIYTYIKQDRISNNPNESFHYTYNRRNLNNDFYIARNLLYENEQTKDKEEILKSLNKSMETGYKEVKNKLTETIVGFIENDPADWYIIQNSRDRMKKLKEAADKEITAKIDLICRTASTASSDLGTKFKTALSKHPVRAESLKNIWAKYADDLDDRIESRIRSITGDNGNSNILTTVKQFLTVTYPNLISVMLYYKLIYYLIRLYTDKFPISTLSLEEHLRLVNARELANTVNLLNGTV